jgi:multidrug efflux pump subunit AcrA (membrane-fusion protein)
MTSDDVTELDPQRAETPEELGRLMHLLYVRAGHSYGSLQKWAKEHDLDKRMPTSTLSNVINGKYPPSRELLEIFLRACQVSSTDMVQWQEARQRIFERRRVPELDSGRPLDSQLVFLNNRLVDAEQQIERLKQHEAELRIQLEAEQANSSRLEQELADLRVKLADQTKLSHELESELAERQRVVERERAEVSQRVHELQTDLKFTIGERERLEEELARLQAEYDGLSEASQNIEDLLDLHFERAEFERRRHEKVVAEAEKLRAELDQLKPLLAHYQHEVSNPAPRQIESGLLERLRNQDIHVEFAAGERDFGRKFQIAVRLAWQCPECERGGSRPYSTCPYDQTPTKHDVIKSVDITLPGVPAYDNPLRVEGEGTHDEPVLQPGDLYVKLVPSPSFWERIGRVMRYIFRGDRL